LRLRRTPHLVKFWLVGWLVGWLIGLLVGSLAVVVVVGGWFVSSSKGLCENYPSNQFYGEQFPSTNQQPLGSTQLGVHTYGTYGTYGTFNIILPHSPSPDGASCICICHNTCYMSRLAYFTAKGCYKIHQTQNC